MTVVYHFVPRNLTGNILYPLNQLKEKHPELYATHAKKYDGRQFLLKTPIPILDCLWNDVLHFSPIHPETIRDAMIKFGRKWRPTQWYEVDTQKLNFTDDNTVFYFSGDTLKDRYFEVFECERLDSMRDIPEKTLAYYRQSLAEGKAPLMFAHVPHILHKGQINLEQVKIIQVD